MTSMESSLAPHVIRVHLMSSKASAVVGGRATLCVSRAEMDCDDYGEDTPRSCPRAGSRQGRQGASPIQHHQVIYNGSRTRSLLIHHLSRLDW